MFGKAALATAALGGFLFFAGAPGAQAADDHSGYSRQADRGRQEWRQGYERSDRHFSYDSDRGHGNYGYDVDRYRSYDQRVDRNWDRDSSRRSRDFRRDRD